MATIPEALAIAIQHQRAGRLQTAEQIYRQIIAADPNHAEALHLLGLIAHQAGRHADAVEYISQAIGSRGDVAAFHNNLGNALKDQGKLDDAVAAYRRALELTPDLAGAHYNLAVALHDQGKLDEAMACYRRTLKLTPHNAQAHYNLGVVLSAQGKLDEAAAAYRRALELKPDYAEAHNNLGLVFSRKGKAEEAAACYRRALELDPKMAGRHSNLGNVLKELGDLRGAEACFRAALRHDSRLVSAHCKLAELLAGNLPEIDLVALRRLVEEAGLDEAQRLALHFAVAQVLDARGEYAAAAAHLDRGHALQLSQWRKCGQAYDPREHELLVDRSIAACTSDFFQRVRDFGLESEVPVFVVGLPRSGTTLIEQILASHSQVFGAEEIELVRDTATALGGRGADFIGGLGQLNCDTVRSLAAQHLERLCALNRQALRIVDKMPDNYIYLGLLATLFPRAKFIHSRRDLRDVAVSCWMTHFQELRWANDPEHIVSRFRDYRRIMAHWRTVLPVPLLEVDYEEAVADVEGVARRLVAWCGLTWEPECLEFYRARRPVRTASAVQVRRPIYSTSVGRWKHYQDALASLLAGLDAFSSRSA